MHEENGLHAALEYVKEHWDALVHVRDHRFSECVHGEEIARCLAELDPRGSIGCEDAVAQHIMHVVAEERATVEALELGLEHDFEHLRRAHEDIVWGADHEHAERPVLEQLHEVRDHVEVQCVHTMARMVLPSTGSEYGGSLSCVDLRCMSEMEIWL